MVAGRDEYDLEQVLQEALDRLTLLADSASAMAGTLDVREGVRGVGEAVVRHLADWCCLDLVRDGRKLEHAGVVHRDPAVRTAVWEGLLVPMPEPPDARKPLEPSQSPEPSEPSETSEPQAPPLLRAVDGGGVQLVLLTPDACWPPQEPPLELYRCIPTRSALLVPVTSKGAVLGVITLGRADPDRPFSSADFPLAEDLAGRIALAIDNFRLYEEVQRTAERLQLSLLPRLPDLDGLQLAARYLPARTMAEVGGDWYDAFRLPGGELALIIGDVTGHDLGAAVTMGGLRNVLRGIACDRHDPPGHILRRTDTVQAHLDPTATATCLYGLVSGPSDDPHGAPHEAPHEAPRRFDYASAGHLPPLLLTADGEARYLDEGQSLLFGVVPDRPRPSAAAELPVGSTMLLYTDGLVERRGESLSIGLERLRANALRLVSRPLDPFCDALLTAQEPDGSDDIAVLALRIPGPEDEAHEAIDESL